MRNQLLDPPCTECESLRQRVKELESTWLSPQVYETLMQERQVTLHDLAACEKELEATKEMRDSVVQDLSAAEDALMVEQMRAGFVAQREVVLATMTQERDMAWADMKLAQGDALRLTEQLVASQEAERVMSVHTVTLTKDAKTPDCKTCDNRGRIYGLSQETHCEHCRYQGHWRTNHYAAIDEAMK